jgi:hypothetical protein
MEAKLASGGSEFVCRCLSGYVKRDHLLGWWGRDTTCLEQTAYNAIKSYDTDTVTYRDLVGKSGTKTVESKLFNQLLIASASGCRRAVQADVALPRGQSLLRGNEACQALANLCVLEMYDADAPSCELYREMQLASAMEVNEESEWKARLPALYYSPGPTVYTLNDVPLTVSLKGEASRLTYVLPTFTPYHAPRTTHHAPRTTHRAPRTAHRAPRTPCYSYVLAAYSLNGTYLGLRELSDELQLCSGKAEDPTAFLKFGVGLKVECRAD